MKLPTEDKLQPKLLRSFPTKPFYDSNPNNIWELGIKLWEQHGPDLVPASLSDPDVPWKTKPDWWPSVWVGALSKSSATSNLEVSVLKHLSNTTPAEAPALTFHPVKTRLRYDLIAEVNRGPGAKAATSIKQIAVSLHCLHFAQESRASKKHRGQSSACIVGLTNTHT